MDIRFFFGRFIGAILAVFHVGMYYTKLIEALKLEEDPVVAVVLLGALLHFHANEVVICTFWKQCHALPPHSQETMSFTPTSFFRRHSAE